LFFFWPYPNQSFSPGGCFLGARVQNSTQRLFFCRSFRWGAICVSAFCLYTSSLILAPVDILWLLITTLFSLFFSFLLVSRLEFFRTCGIYFPLATCTLKYSFLATTLSPAHPLRTRTFFYPLSHLTFETYWFFFYLQGPLTLLVKNLKSCILVYYPSVPRALLQLPFAPPSSLTDPFLILDFSFNCTKHYVLPLYYVDTL